jgi:nitroreductase/NAD-dependent dihydropyrimidine dehydrogenase PreA subunit
MPTIDKDRCTLCGSCIPVCVRRILQKGKEGIEITDPAICLDCGHCKAVCPEDAPRFSRGNEEFEPAPGKEEAPAPESFLRFLRRRRSLRVYRDKPVEREKLALILQAGRYAPTGSNRQGCHYTVARGRGILDQVCSLATRNLQEQGRRIQEAIDRHRRLQAPLAEEYAARQHLPPVWDRIARKWQEGVAQLLHQAPALVLIHTVEGFSTTPEMDAGIASAQMTLMAETLGLGTCYIAFLIWALKDSQELRSLLQVPAGNRPLAAFTLGYADVAFLRLVARSPARVAWLGE